MLNILMKYNIILINIYGEILFYLRFLKYLEHKKLLHKNTYLASHNKSQRCYIIGTGPSLKNIDLMKLDGDTIVLNKFYKFNAPLNFKPTYGMIIDGDFYTENDNTIKKTIEKYPNIKMILNGKYMKVKSELKTYENSYFIDIWRGYFSPHKELDFSKVECSFINVSCCAVSYAMYLGYNEINLLGCDFSSFAVRKPNYCYTDNKNINPLMNDLYGFAIAADTHAKIYDYAKQHGIKITNVTNNSLLDVYPQSEQEYLKLTYDKD